MHDSHDPWQETIVKRHDHNSVGHASPPSSQIFPTTARFPLLLTDDSRRSMDGACLVHVAAEELVVAPQPPNEALGRDYTVLLLVVSYLHGHEQRSART